MSFNRLLGKRAVRLKNQFDGFSQVGPGLIQGCTLRVGARKLFDKANISFRDLLKYSSQFHYTTSTVDRKANYSAHVFLAVQRQAKRSCAAFHVHGCARRRGRFTLVGVRVAHPNLRSLPPYAPELNPDELTWGHIKTRIAKATTQTKEELKAMVERTMAPTAEDAPDRCQLLSCAYLCVCHGMRLC